MWREPEDRVAWRKFDSHVASNSILQGKVDGNRSRGKPAREWLERAGLSLSDMLRGPEEKACQSWSDGISGQTVKKKDESKLKIQPK